MKRSKPKPTLLALVDDVLDAGADAYESARELEVALAGAGLLQPHMHKTMKRYLQLWKTLKVELKHAHVVAERREVVQRLGGMKCKREQDRK